MSYLDGRLHGRIHIQMTDQHIETVCRYGGDQFREENCKYLRWSQTLGDYECLRGTSEEKEIRKQYNPGLPLKTNCSGPPDFTPAYRDPLNPDNDE